MESPVYNKTGMADPITNDIGMAYSEN